jgi:DNA-binding winged helix-turn-helix (wHTH) protein
MHILVFGSVPDNIPDVKQALGGTADRYTVCATWPDTLTALEDDAPDLVMVDRGALLQLEPADVAILFRPGLWPPIIIADRLSPEVQDGARLIRTVHEARAAFYEVGDLRIDTRRKRVGMGTRWSTLPPIQYRLLVALARRAGEVVSYQSLLRSVWGYEGETCEARELLKVHIRQIRRRLGLDPDKHAYIQSVRGFGYMLAAPEDSDPSD